MKIKQIIMKTLGGMTYGLFATLIIGVIIRQIGYLVGLELLHTVIYNRLVMLLGIGIGLGMGLSLKLDGLKLVVLAVIGGIATSFKLTFDQGFVFGLNNEPGTIYLVVLLSYLVLRYVWVKRTPFDLLLVPLVGITVGIIFTLLISPPMTSVIGFIQNFVQTATIRSPIVMSIIVSAIMGIILTSPFSSAAVAIAINLNGIAAGAAVIGTTTQMIGFAIQSRKDNSIGVVLSIAFGTSMLQMKNIIKKPIIWLPTIIASMILGPLFVLFGGIESSREGAGMGSSGLVGQLQTLEVMNYSQSAWIMIVLTLVAPLVLVYIVDLIFRKTSLIKTGDLKIQADI